MWATVARTVARWRLEPLTRDHSLVEAQIAAGLLDEAMSLPAEQRNVLVRVIGREPEVDVELKEVPVQPGDYVLLCSDGLTRMVSDGVMANAFRVSGAAADLRLPDCRRQQERRRGQHHRGGGGNNRQMVASPAGPPERISQTRAYAEANAAV